MWLVTNVGFFSVVERQEDVGCGVLTIRARVRSDLEALKLIYLPNMAAISETRDADYRFRSKVNRSDVAHAMGKMVEGIAYSNFKDEVMEVQGYGRAALYAKLWTTLYQLQQDRDAYETDLADVVNQIAVPFASDHCAVLVSGEQVLVRTVMTAEKQTVFWHLIGRVMGHPQHALLHHVYHVTGYEAEVAVPCSIQAPDTFADWGHYIIPLPPTSGAIELDAPGYNWMSFDEARGHITSMLNVDMRSRDMALLDTVQQQLKGLYIQNTP